MNVRVSPVGFIHMDPDLPRQLVSWSDIVEIRAYKLDLLTTDEVRFAFSLRDGTVNEVSEEQPGFDEFMAALKSRFPAVEGWEERVVKPAFGASETILYRGT